MKEFGTKETDVQVDLKLTIYITRHGETEWNVQRRMQGWCDSPLTENGINDARLFGERVADVYFDAVYTSPSQRAHRTAELVCGERNIPIIVEECLKEINMGDWEGCSIEFLQENYPEELFTFWNEPHLYKTTSGEDYSQLRERIQSVLDRIIANHPSGNILIVTHGVVVKCLLAIFKGTALENFWEPPHIGNASLTIVELTDGKVKVLLEADSTYKQL